jgi:hypothetical protein
MLKRFSLISAMTFFSILNAGNYQDAIEKVEEIKEMAKSIDPNVAAQLYYDSNRNAVNKFFSSANFKIFSTAKSKEALEKGLAVLLQNLSNVTSKEMELEHAIYSATFTDETVKDIKAAMLLCLQDTQKNLNQYLPTETQATETQEHLAQIFKTEMISFFINCIDSIAAVLEKHGYKIYR